MALTKVTYTDLVTIIGAQNLNDIQDAIIALEEWQTEVGADIPQILANIAPSFSNSTSYSAGDCVIVLNKLYQFTADHPAGNWTGTDATEVNVTSLLEEAADSLSGEVDSVKAQALASYATDTASGAIASFPDGADDIPAKDLTVAIEPLQSGSGDPSPSNIRPISGWSGANVTRTGKNLLDQSKCIARKYVTNSGNLGDSSDWCASDYTPIKGGQTYTVSGYEATGWAACHAFYDNNKDFISAVYAINHSTFTSPNNAVYVRLSIKSETTTVAQLELGSTASSYVPYSGDTISITFPSAAGTVYGGTLDVTTGVLTVDMAMVDMGTLNWMYYSAQQRIVAQVNSGKTAATNIGLDGACSVYKVVNTGYAVMPDKSIIIGNNFISNQYAAMVVYDSDYTDAETFKTAVSGQTLVFPLKNPVTYQLTPTEVTTLLGTNNIWADCGDSTVEYRADTKLYIDKKIAALAAAMN